jgi:hypothetical protein
MRKIAILLFAVVALANAIAYNTYRYPIRVISVDKNETTYVLGPSLSADTVSVGSLLKIGGVPFNPSGPDSVGISYWAHHLRGSADSSLYGVPYPTGNMFTSNNIRDTSMRLYHNREFQWVRDTGQSHYQYLSGPHLWYSLWEDTVSCEVADFTAMHAWPTHADTETNQLFHGWFKKMIVRGPLGPSTPVYGRTSLDGGGWSGYVTGRISSADLFFSTMYVGKDSGNVNRPCTTAGTKGAWIGSYAYASMCTLQYGAQIDVKSYGGKTINMTALRLKLEANNSGYGTPTVTTAYCIDPYIANAGTMTTGRVFNANALDNTGGTITSYTGFYMTKPSVWGTMTNAYGFYSDSVWKSGVNCWSIYTAHGNRNYFGTSDSGDIAVRRVYYNVNRNSDSALASVGYVKRNFSSDTFMVRAGGAAYTADAKFGTIIDSCGAIDTIQISGLNVAGKRVRILSLAGASVSVFVIDGTILVKELTANGKYCDLEYIPSPTPRWWLVASN